MKCLFVLIISAFTVSSNGQAYIPTLEDGKEWTHKVPQGMGVFTYYSYHINCDTILGGQQYYIARQKNGNIVGFLLEDTIGKKIYSYNTVSLQDSLFIDYSVHIGDTVQIWYGSGYDIVDSITMEFLYQKNRKVIHITSIEKYIEGIGRWLYGVNTNPFYAPGQVMDIKTYLKCGQTPNSVLNVDIGVSIFPNPVKNRLAIDFQATKRPKKFEIYNITGQLVLQSAFQPIIDVSNLPNGMYVLQLDTYPPTKFIKE